jgi:hypothetical protein
LVVTAVQEEWMSEGASCGLFAFSLNVNSLKAIFAKRFLHSHAAHPGEPYTGSVNLMP